MTDSLERVATHDGDGAIGERILAALREESIDIDTPTLVMILAEK